MNLYQISNLKRVKHFTVYGVLRLILDKKIIQVKPYMGLLHRGTEKFKVKKHIFCLIVEYLLNINVSLRSLLRKLVLLKKNKQL